MVDLLGWVATVLFVLSYFFSDTKLRILQAISAGIWAVYGFLISAVPVLVTNLLLIMALGITFLLERRKKACRKN